MSETRIQWGGCHNEGCEQPCPMDMVGIIIFDEIYCSPECAKEGLAAMPDEPHEVALHDPQLVVDREQFDMDPSSIDFIRQGPEPATEKIEAVADLFPGEFRISHDSLGE